MVASFGAGSGMSGRKSRFDAHRHGIGKMKLSISTFRSLCVRWTCPLAYLLPQNMKT